MTYNLWLREFLPPRDTGACLPGDMILLSLLLYPVAVSVVTLLVRLGSWLDLSLLHSCHLWGQVLPTCLFLFVSQLCNPLPPLSRYTVSGLRSTEMSVVMKVSLVCQSFISTGIQMMGLWTVPTVLQSALIQKKRKPGRLCVLIQKSTGVREQEGPLGYYSLPLASRRADHERESPGSPARPVGSSLKSDLEP